MAPSDRRTVATSGGSPSSAVAAESDGDAEGDADGAALGRAEGSADGSVDAFGSADGVAPPAVDRGVDDLASEIDRCPDRITEGGAAIRDERVERRVDLRAVRRGSDGDLSGAFRT